MRIWLQNFLVHARAKLFHVWLLDVTKLGVSKSEREALNSLHAHLLIKNSETRVQRGPGGWSEAPAAIRGAGIP